VLTIAGDVDAKVAVEKVRKYFDSIPPGPAAPPLDTTEPVQKEERRTVVNDPLARLTLVDIAYQVPGGINPDMDALSALATVMGSGRSSRLYESIVRQQQVAVQAGAGVVAAKGPTFMYLEGMAGPGKDPAAVERAIYAEVERVQKGPIQEWELDKARNAARRSLVGSLGSSLQRAILLARFTAFYNDPGIVNTRYERIASLKIDDLQRVARQYLVSANRAVVVTMPAKPGATGATGAKGAGGAQ